MSFTEVRFTDTATGVKEGVRVLCAFGIIDSFIIGKINGVKTRLVPFVLLIFLDSYVLGPRKLYLRHIENNEFFRNYFVIKVQFLHFFTGVSFLCFV